MLMLLVLARAAMLVLLTGATLVLIFLTGTILVLVLLAGTTLVLAGTALVLVLLVLAAQTLTLIASHNRPRLGISARRAILVVLIMGPVPAATVLGVSVILHVSLAFLHLRLPLAILVDIGVARHFEEWFLILPD